MKLENKSHLPSLLSGEGAPLPKLPPPYTQAWDSLRKMESVVHFQTKWGVGPLKLIFLVGIVLALKFSRLGSSILVVVFLAIFAAIAFVFVNGIRLALWRCPRCKTRWPGWIQKDVVCWGCGLRLYQDT